MSDIIFHIVIVLGVILVSMTLHEVMHGMMAYWLGDNTAKSQGRLTLNPLHHIDPFLTVALPVILVVVSLMSGGATPIFGGAKPVPFNPAQVRYGVWGSALVALAGPLTNLVLAFIFYGVAVFAGTDNAIAMTVLGYFVTVNLGFFVFNMLPLPPLDGSRVLYALAPEFIRRGMEAIERYGIVLVFVIVMLASSAIGSLMVAAISGLLEAFRLIYGA